MYLDCKYSYLFLNTVELILAGYSRKIRIFVKILQ